LTTGVNNTTIGRITAAVWGAIALGGAIATIGPLKIPGSDTSQMREIAGLAAMLAGVSFVLPWRRLPHVAFSIGLILMSGVIAALVNASGAADSGLTILFTFVVALAASFMPVRASVAQLAVIAALLMGLVLVVGRSDGTHIEVLRVTLLLATLIVLCGLVLILRATLDQRALGMRSRGSHRYSSVLLDQPQFDAALDTELSRAGRHERPLAVVVLEVFGSVAEAQGRRRGTAEAAIVRTIVEGIRIEDSVGKVGDLRFAMLAPETTSAGVATMASKTADIVRHRLHVAGFEPDGFEVAVGWAEFPHRATTRDAIMAAAIGALEASRGGAAEPYGEPGASTEPATGPA
jgi:GGDEF domain-containing protein